MGFSGPQESFDDSTEIGSVVHLDFRT